MQATLDYAYVLIRQPDDYYRAELPQLPECEVIGPTIKDVVEQLETAIVDHLEVRLREQTPLPQARPPFPGEHICSLTLTHALKLELNLLMREKGVGVTELAHHLHCLPQEASRIVRLSHPTKIERLLEALRAIGYKLRWEVRPLESPLS